MLIGGILLSLNFAFAGTNPPTDKEKSYEWNPDVSDSIYADRICTISNDIPFTYNDEVRKAIDYFADRKRGRDFIRKVLKRQELFFSTFEAKLAENDMPDDLKYLSVIESGLNPTIGSRAGAIGLWQFMPATGRMMGLDQDYYVDERMNPEKSTEAACKYLGKLYKMFGDWELALASYNCGPGNVRRAIRKSGYKETFWEIYPYLPRETRFYVPKFIAINYLMRYAEEHNIFVEDKEYYFDHDTLMVSQYFNMEAFAEHSNICLDDLCKLNPQIKKNILPSSTKNYALKVPKDKKSFVEANRSWLLDSAKKHEPQQVAHNSSSSGSHYVPNKPKIVHRVKSGEYLGKIASYYNVRVSQIKSWNELYSDNIRVGQKLDIYKDPSYFKKTTPKPATNTAAASSNVNTSDFNNTYIVQPGDTLWSISKKYEVSIEQLKKANNLSSDKLTPGQKLKVT